MKVSQGVVLSSMLSSMLQRVMEMSDEGTWLTVIEQRRAKASFSSSDGYGFDRFE